MQIVKICKKKKELKIDPTSHIGVVETKSSQIVAIGEKISCEKDQTV